MQIEISFRNANAGDTTSVLKGISDALDAVAVSSEVSKEGKVLSAKTATEEFTRFFQRALLNNDATASNVCLGIVAEGKASGGALIKIWKRFENQRSRFAEKEDVGYVADMATVAQWKSVPFAMAEDQAQVGSNGFEPYRNALGLETDSVIA
jgi:hypothetical protein